MCGIAGIAGRTLEGDGGLLGRMRDGLAHRGPDDAGMWWSSDGAVGLAHRRLSIIDLTAAGHQPMHDGSDALWITFNGEIYNHRQLRHRLEALGHRFQSATDTEVILAAFQQWGADCLERLDGMFAFVIYDAARRRLFAARDRAGEKPLYYRLANGRLTFASELKALMQDPKMERRLDPAALDFYLAYGYVPRDWCVMKGSHKLPAAHAFSFDVGTQDLRVWQYWRLPESAPQAHAREEDLVAELEHLLRAAVSRQLVADVPVGVLLSGGLDSSLITAVGSQVAGSALRTFTVTFPGAGTHDEGPFARVVADHFGTDHTELVAEPTSVDLLPLLARQFDEPIADSAIVPTYLVSKLIRSSATVALGGDGGDELFGGYPHYSWLLKGDRLRRWIPSAARHGVARMAAHLPTGVRGRNHLVGFGSDGAASIAHVNLYFDADSRRRLAPVLSTLNGRATAESVRAGWASGSRSILQEAMRTDFHTTMADGYLVKLDRASMLNSLEVRAPWLDRQIIEFAASRVPDSLKVTHDSRKILPRRLGARLLPAALDLKRKQGFTMPLAAWFKGEWGAFVRDVLSSADRTLFDAAEIRSLQDSQRRGLANTGRLFSLTMFELWRREYGAAL